MRVCDRHIDRVARHRILVVEDDAGFDLCDECKTDVLQLLSAPVINGAGEHKRRGRPPKNLAQAE